MCSRSHTPSREISSNATSSFCYGEEKGKEIPRLKAFDEYIHNHVAKIISFLFCFFLSDGTQQPLFSRLLGAALLRSSELIYIHMLNKSDFASEGATSTLIGQEVAPTSFTWVEWSRLKIWDMPLNSIYGSNQLAPPGAMSEVDLPEIWDMPVSSIYGSSQ